MSQIRVVPLLLAAASAATALLIATTSIDAQAPRAAAPAVAQRTVQDGVYSAAQAARGQTLYTQRCAGCHGATLGGAQAPPLEGAAFRSKWRKEPLSALFIKIRYTMPPQADPAAVTDAQRLPPDQGADLVAHILKSNGFPAGAADFAAADATSSPVGWPAAPAGEEVARTAVSYVPAANVNQLMRGIFFPNSNLIFTVQELEPDKLPPQPATKPGGPTIFEWGQMLYTGWPVVENSALALADASTVMLLPGLRCENGTLAPTAEPDWIRFTDQMIAVAKRTYRLAQTRNQEAVAEYTETLSNTCNACHAVYRGGGGRGGGRPGGGGNAAGAAPAGRCAHR